MLPLAALALSAALHLAAPAAAQPIAVPQSVTRWPIKEADFTVSDFRFGSGETLASVTLHYATLGSPRRNAAGDIDNAVLVLHGTGGSGRQFLQPQFAGELFGPGQPLDSSKYWIILPDSIGHGQSSRPSEGLHMRFPKYDYDDMVDLQHRLLTDGLGIKQTRLIIGTSMGCMHSFVWGERYPGFSRALMPMACQPVKIAGVNRMWRQLLIDAIKADPAWMNGEYKTQPSAGMRVGATLAAVVTVGPLNYQKLYPTPEAAVTAARERMTKALAGSDANDMIYQFASSRNYDPWPNLARITAPLTWINSADDFINGHGFSFTDEAVKAMPNARFRMIAETPDTHGHSTHTWAVNWKSDLIELLARSAKTPTR